MNLRRNVALATGALVFAVPALSSCAFSYPTDEIYTPAAGANNRSGSVDVLNGVIVASEDGSGTFIATLSNNNIDEATTLDTISGGGDDADLTVKPFAAIEIPAGGFVNLADDPAIKVSGAFLQGDFVEVVLDFDNGEQTSLKVPVVVNGGEHADLDGPAPAEESPTTESH